MTYEVITEESASQGDAAERGFVLPGSWRIDVDIALADKEGEYDMTLREALDLVHPQEDSGSWFSEVDPRINYRTGENEYRSLHPPDHITSASYARLRRLFRIPLTWSAEYRGDHTMNLSNAQRLAKQATDSATFRGHRLGTWRWYHEATRTQGSAECVDCGRSAHVNTKPTANDIDISGEAVALNCSTLVDRY